MSLASWVQKSEPMAPLPPSTTAEEIHLAFSGISCLGETAEL
jgi:hypothetical protein